MNNYDDAPQLLRDFLMYNSVIKARSDKSVTGYYVDLKMFLRYMMILKGKVDRNTPLDEIVILDINIDFIKSITITDTYGFIHYLSNERKNSATTRARKISSIKSFYNYLTVKQKLLETNIMVELDVPSVKQALPKYLSLDQCHTLLKSISGAFAERDFCIITLFLNCGMRLSELVGMSLGDITGNQLRLLGKGNKERIIYLNQACIDSIANYLPYRSSLKIDKNDQYAFFLNRNGKRLGARRVEQIVNNRLKEAQLDQYGYTVHKLRHTAATLMYQNGKVDIRVLQEILGHSNLGTTQIYTHTSSEQMEQASKSINLAGNIKPPKTKTSSDENSD